MFPCMPLLILLEWYCMHATSNTSNQISHDPATVTVESPQPPTPTKKPIVLIAVAGVVLLLIGALWWFFTPFKVPTNTEQSVIAPSLVNDTVLFTVGTEDIFAEDLKQELSLFPESMHAEIEQGIKERLITESIILQAGAQAGYIQLSAQVFDSPYKDRTQRRQLLEQVKTAVNDKAAYRKGGIAAIFFLNFKPGPIGYEAGKQLALEKITALHQQVKNGTITIEQAGEAIKNDSSLRQVDSAYKSNAYSEFDTRTNQKITFDEAFNQALATAKEGEVTEIFTGQDIEGENYGDLKDAMYQFGQVTEIQPGEATSFDAWLAEVRENYAVVTQ